MRSGKRQIMERIELPLEERIRTVREKEHYKYFEILEPDINNYTEIKEK